MMGGNKYDCFQKKKNLFGGIRWCMSSDDNALSLFILFFVLSVPISDWLGVFVWLLLTKIEKVTYSAFMLKFRSEYSSWWRPCFPFSFSHAPSQPLVLCQLSIASHVPWFGTNQSYKNPSIHSYYPHNIARHPSRCFTTTIETNVHEDPTTINRRLIGNDLSTDFSRLRRRAFNM